ncbi:hypothetical protein Xmau_03817 [Xenorhabdus mauleonii]|uniref:Uncharacterized protein n=1 Tax=Xenorhabdus mauleonii TaxID=351675 RepID=A0A1I3V2E2_9GAMM|nr:hypothetical protein [Xenorhabdus mauleonii]PHM37600.1 hypothetical protein Xmau_03817 [Xenorhabdus mauleonii]SFJ89405.1 hypothetical protein SAMN05421680_11922 [Xenorhabdus mauleonii]
MAEKIQHDELEEKIQKFFKEKGFIQPKNVQLIVTIKDNEIANIELSEGTLQRIH